MKKLIGIGIAAMMVMGLAGAASAAVVADTDWYVQLKATTDASAKMNGASTAKVGMTTGTEQVQAYTAPYATTTCEIAISDSATARTYIYNKKGVADPATKEWAVNFKVWGSAAFNDVYLTAVNPTGGDLGVDSGFNVSIYQMVSGQRSWLYTFDPAQNGAISGTTGVSGSFFQKSFAYAGTPLEFQVVAAPVPEPGSIVAMLSGLVGLAGFGIRRRK